MLHVSISSAFSSHHSIKAGILLGDFSFLYFFFFADIFWGKTLYSWLLLLLLSLEYLL